MALPARAMHIPAGLPLDEATRPELLDVGRANVGATNVRQDHRGALTKRLGYAALDNRRIGEAARTAGRRLLSFDGAACVIDGARLDVFGEVANRSAVASRVPEASVTTRTLANGAPEPYLFAAVECGGYVASAVLRGKDVLVSVETSDGVVVRSPEAVYTSGSSAPAVAAMGTYGTIIILIATDADSANIKAWYLDTSSPGTVANGWHLIGTVATDKSTDIVSSIALSVQALDDRIAFAYAIGSGSARVGVKTVSVIGVLESRAIGSSTTPLLVSAVGSVADTLWLAWYHDASTIKLAGLDADALATTLASEATLTVASTPGVVPAAPFIAPSQTTPGACRVLVNDDDAINVISFSTVAGAVSVGSNFFVYGAQACAAPFVFGGREYALFTSSANDGSIVLGDFTDASPSGRSIRPVAVAFPSLAVPSVSVRPIVRASSVSCAMLVQRSAAGYSVEFVTYDFADRKRWRAVEHGGLLYLAGGVLSHFDGRRVAEVGFLHAPAQPEASDTGTGSGVTGPVRYVATYEEIDARGNWHTSGVSEPSAALTITDNAASVHVAPLALSARLDLIDEDRVRVSLWRTSQTGEAPYYFVGSASCRPIGAGTAVTFSDTTTDAVLTTRRMLYGTGSLPGTNGAAQDRRAPPYCADLVSYNGMLVVASGSTLWWSGQAIDGEGAWFSPAFTTPIPGVASITALAAQDGTLYVFGERAIYAVAGEAPSDNGMSGGLGTPRRLASDVGCIDASSVVVTSAGVFFRSLRGIELLTRGGAVTWIGEAVQDTLATYPVVSSAVLDDAAGLVRFSLAASEASGAVSGEGRDLVFDLGLGAWVSVDDKTGATAHEASQDAALVLVGGAWRYAWLGTDGTVYTERDEDDAAAHLDGDAFAFASYELPPWKMGLQQEQRIYEAELLFERVGAAGLAVDLAYDFGAYTETKTWAEAALVGQRQVSFRPKPQTTAVQVRVRETEPATPGTGAGLSFIGISADIAPKQGPTRSTTRLNPELRR